ncbi:hypothetical protein C1H46_032829 [Malus baccata]|uniref:F-box domain-containing protein n=1 Tax=Malus baccata TaxID=106549 RepID=A0A540L541_MALBA|nr:hypothetical protein C1H46_032829 [Malus baccata]
MSKPLERYQKLVLKESLPKIHRYPFACRELSLILRGAYKKFPKNLQSLIFQDTLTAFRLLPEMQTRNAVLAAHLLLQSGEAALPKQKKNLAVAEYKNAMVAHKRRTKARQEEKVSGSTQLPQDVLVHIFGFLDMQSLASVGLVCWSWNIAASDNHLWETQYATFFGKSEDDKLIKARKLSGRRVEDEEGYTLFWKEAFKRAYLARMQTRNAVLAAHLLLQSAEAALPKQKKNLAVAEYKNAMVAHKRRTKARQEEKVSGSTQLPQDVLVHIFGFLDMQSLASVGLVCWSWNIAASDNHLWETQYATFFGKSEDDKLIKARTK